MISCLKIKINATALSTNSRPSELKALIDEVIMNGPYDLAGELLKLESIDFKTISASICREMTIDVVHKIISEYDRGLLTDEQYYALFSANCVGQWSALVFKELRNLGLTEAIPSTIFESANAYVSDLEPETLLRFIKEAVDSDKREMMFWNRWTRKLTLNQAKKVYGSPHWNDSHPMLWQTINCRNFAIILQINYVARMNLIDFIGMKHLSAETEERIEVRELVQRCYTLISFYKIIESDYLLSKENGILGIDDEAFILLVTDLNAKMMTELRILIKEKDESIFDIVEDALNFLLDPPKHEDINISVRVNSIFENFMNFIDTVIVGDFFINILVILHGYTRFIEIEPMKKFLDEFMKRRPSADGFIYIYQLLEYDQKDFEFIKSAFEDILLDRPEYLMEIYKQNPNLLESELILKIPLKQRFLKFLRNPYQIPIKSAMEYDLPNFYNFSGTSELRRLMEIVTEIGWGQLNSFQVCYCGEKVVSIPELVQEYLILFLREKYFYEVVGHEDFGARPIIRLIPIFPVNMWHQLAYLLTRARLFRIKVPFIIDFDFFSAAFAAEPNNLITEICYKIEFEAEKQMITFYSFLATNAALEPMNLKQKMMEHCMRLENLKAQESTVNNSKSTGSHFDLNAAGNIDEKDAKASSARRRSIKELSIHFKEVESMRTYYLIDQGLKSFNLGLSKSMNLREFTTNEVHRILFHSNF